MQVMPGSSCSVVEDAKDLNPFRVRLFRYNGCSSLRRRMTALLRAREQESYARLLPGEAAPMSLRGRGGRYGDRWGVSVSQVLLGHQHFTAVATTGKWRPHR
jgi:hypothetical protein